MRWPRSLGSRLYLGQLVTVALGLALVVLGHWRVGIAVTGAIFLAASGARALVSPDHMGMLQVRGKAFDIAWMTFLGVILIVLAFVVPSQPE